MAAPLKPHTVEKDLHQGSRRWRILFSYEQWSATPMAILSLLWLGIAVLELSNSSNAVLDTVATIIWVIFIVDYVIRLAIAPHKVKFFRRNILTLIALIVPALRLFRAVAALRAATVLRGANLIRVLGVVNRTMNSLRKTLNRRAFSYVVGLTIAVLFAGAAGMYNFEPAKQVQGGFTSYWDALWWTAMLLTSIGSQYWPQTGEGRVLGFLLSLYGLGILGYMTATLASFFIGRDADSDEGEVAGAGDIAALRKEIQELKALILNHPSLAGRGDSAELSGGGGSTSPSPLVGEGRGEGRDKESRPAIPLSRNAADAPNRRQRDRKRSSSRT